ncbi:MAG: hypothetical protein OEW15_02450 [Nitrospirota bacterium]|nr:hypothetical protein [Nitrospirota bacterium]
MPINTSRKRQEADFVLAFGRTYQREEQGKSTARCHAFDMARELHVPGLGIADIVSVCISPRKKTLQAFEMKIRDWRKALAQSYRYKYFADSVYVVLPPDEADKAKQALSDFRTFNVGLWAFDAESGIINKIYSPKKDKPISETAYTKALSLLGLQLTTLPAS